MPAAQKLTLVSAEEYLATEMTSPNKHEYLGGVVYDIAGSTNLHGAISGNVHGA